MMEHFSEQVFGCGWGTQRPVLRKKVVQIKLHTHRGRPLNVYFVRSHQIVTVIKSTRTCKTHAIIVLSVHVIDQLVGKVSENARFITLLQRCPVVAHSVETDRLQNRTLNS